MPADRSDASIGAAASRVIDDDPLLDASGLRLEVHDGVVHLSGRVRTAMERARVERDAHAATPMGVDVHEVRIAGGYDDGTLRGGDVPEYSDADIAMALVDAFKRDPRVESYVPAIDVRDGAVELFGEAPTHDAARAIEEDARNVAGVTRVRVGVEPATTAVGSNAGIASPQPGTPAAGGH